MAATGSTATRRTHTTRWIRRTLTAILLISVSAAAASEPARFAGRWLHDVGASQQGYLSGEYPGMSMEIEVKAENLRVTQWVGEVQDGFPLPGSGETTVEYDLIADGVERRLPLGHTGWRKTTVSWHDGSLRLSFPFGEIGRFEETWSVSTDGSRLTIERRRWRGDDETVQRIVFRRGEA